MFKFETLEVWKKAQKLCHEVIDDVKGLPIEYRYTIGNNLVRAVISIPNNIAEGTGRKSKREAYNFYNIAKGSAYEVVNVSMILNEKKLINQKRFCVIYSESEEICRMLTGLIRI